MLREAMLRGLGRPDLVDALIAVEWHWKRAIGGIIRWLDQAIAAVLLVVERGVRTVTWRGTLALRLRGHHTHISYVKALITELNGSSGEGPILRYPLGIQKTKKYKNVT